MDDAIDGEKFMNMCDVYIGEQWNFDRLGSFYKAKCVYASKLVEEWDNPKLIFCFLNQVAVLQEKLHLLKNPFILVSHLHDTSITYEFSKILESNKVLHWFSQNIEIEHPKLTNLPVGIPNPFWNPIGQLHYWETIQPLPISQKSDIFFGFGVDGLPPVRQIIKDTLIYKGLVWGGLPYKDRVEYLNALATKAKYCICPEGWGKDCFRTWESYYTNVYPIAKRCPFTEKIAREFPMILLNNWDDFDMNNIPEPDIKFSDVITEKIKFSYYQKQILDKYDKMFNNPVLGKTLEFYKHCK
jgi:hypothetical protein